MRHLLQSAIWADFHESLGTNVIRHQSTNGNFIAFFERSHGKVGKILSRLYVPYGPYAETPEALKVALSEIEMSAKECKADYIRVEPTGFIVPEEVMQSCGYQKRHKPSQPENTSIVDIKNKTEDDIIAGMNATNRNLWRANRTKSDGLRFTTSYDSRDTTLLIDMMRTTAERLGIVFHDADYTAKMVDTLGPQRACGVVYAVYEGKEIAGAQFVVDVESKTLYYLHAGAYFEARAHNAGNLLLTHLILHAHERGMDSVDLFGVAPKGARKDHPYAGFSSFKRSFGGIDVSYSGTWEKGISPLKYALMKRVRN
jgi:lipid II:glycine glycyltransferase (peptidoglycan interpeptide bridge formation enzyme)